MKIINTQYLREALQNSDRIIVFYPVCLKTAGGNYFFYGKERMGNKTQDICVTIPETEFDELIRLSKNRQKYIQLNNLEEC